jgi:hypothetical protein
MVMEWIPIVSVITSSIMVVFIVALVTKSRERRLESQMQMQTRLIDRFGSSNELAAFLQSPAGRQFVTGVSAVPRMFARERIVAAFTRAIILTSVGVAFVMIALIQGDSDWYTPAAIVFSLGLGYLMAAVVTWRFSQKFVADDELPPAATNNA